MYNRDESEFSEIKIENQLQQFLGIFLFKSSSVQIYLINQLQLEHERIDKTRAQIIWFLASFAQHCELVVM